MKTSTILITGATSGIGRASALELARRGHRVFASGRRQEALDALAKEAGDAPLHTLRLDVTDPASIAAARDAVLEATGGLGVDVVINNAGYGQGGAVIDLTDAQLRAQFDTNVFGLVAVTRAFAGPMIARGEGRVICVSSIAGHVTIPFFGAYHASKHAVRALADAMRVELGALGIGVVLIEPGPIRTEFGATSIRQFAQLRDADSPFHALYERVEAIEERIEVRSADVSVVVRAIVDAVERRRPRIRYIVPFSSRLLVAALRFVPDGARDAFWRAVLRFGGWAGGSRRRASAAA